MLIAVCETHKLSLAQTWVPCKHRNIVAGGSSKKGSCIGNDFHSSWQDCMSTIVEACYATDPDMMEFQEACSEQHLLKGKVFLERHVHPINHIFQTMYQLSIRRSIHCCTMLACLA